MQIKILQIIPLPNVYKALIGDGDVYVNIFALVEDVDGNRWVEPIIDPEFGESGIGETASEVDGYRGYVEREYK